MLSLKSLREVAAARTELGSFEVEVEAVVERTEVLLVYCLVKKMPVKVNMGSKIAIKASPRRSGRGKLIFLILILGKCKYV